MVRSFTDEPLASDIVTRILESARRAPSAGNTQGTALLVFEAAQTSVFWDATLRRGEARDAFPWPDLLRAPLVVAVLAHKDAYLDRYAEPDKGWTDRDERRWPAPYWDIDAGFAALMMLLTAVDLDLGALFFGVPDEAIERLRAATGFPLEVHPIGAVAVGHPAADRPSGSLARPRRALDEMVHRARW
jgi:nitroreductase